ncbi:uncharacterized protein LTHEOB_1194 [Neofusicoccum parvum]|nr:uncharacterized protein LTHEOB_1194 [Neofusicoccum parvum]
MTVDSAPDTPPNVRIIEVGPRDGLQNIAKAVPTSTKIELISQLRSAGLQSIELTSAVSPKAIPQLADNKTLLSSNVVKSLMAQENLRLPVLVPNTKGLEIAIDHGCKEVAVFISASEGFSKANTNCTVAEGIERAGKVASAAISAGLSVRGYVSSIFACPYDGPTPASAVLECVQQLLSMGCYEVSLGDTIGVGVASNVRELLNFLFRHGIPAEKLAGHFHDTHGQAVSNVWQAYECGIRAFDSSVAGLGGCPFAPGAKGNVATEDVVYLFHAAGITTGVDLPRLAAVGSWISAQLSKPHDSRAGAAFLSKPQPATRKPADQRGPSPLRWDLTSESDGLQVYRSGATMKIVLNRPANGNALTTPMIHELTALFHRAASDASISRIALTANGKFFCTGMDLAAGRTPVSQSRDERDAQFARLTQLFAAIDNAPQVTIACLNGPAFGGGVGLAFACDVRMAVAAARLALSEVRLGLCAATISRYVAREWGAAFAREAMVSGRPVAAAELERLGAVAVVVEDGARLGEELDRYVRRLRGSAPRASALSKELVRLGCVGAGGEVQDRGIKAAFDEMMRPDSEAAFGVREFQAGRREVDWDKFVLAKTKSRL